MWETGDMGEMGDTGVTGQMTREMRGGGRGKGERGEMGGGVRGGWEREQIWRSGREELAAPEAAVGRCEAVWAVEALHKLRHQAAGDVAEARRHRPLADGRLGGEGQAGGG